MLIAGHIEGVTYGEEIRKWGWNGWEGLKPEAGLVETARSKTTYNTTP